MGNNIKRGDQIVADFLDSIKDGPSVDMAIVALIKELYEQDKLTNTKLQQGLTELRQASLLADAAKAEIE